MASTLTDTLRAGALNFHIPITEHDADRLIQLLHELARWNDAYNLTAITDPEEMLTHHLLDSLSIHSDLHGQRIADVGTGAGFPGLPLALVNPDKAFTLIDSNGKKLRFVGHAARLLHLENVTTLHTRVETFRPEMPFDTVIARAFAPLALLLQRVGSLCGSHTRVLAMKGNPSDTELATLPPRWKILDNRPITVPGLKEARCLLTLARQPG